MGLYQIRSEPDGEKCQCIVCTYNHAIAYKFGSLWGYKTPYISDPFWHLTSCPYECPKRNQLARPLPPRYNRQLRLERDHCQRTVCQGCLAVSGEHINVDVLLQECVRYQLSTRQGSGTIGRCSLQLWHIWIPSYGSPRDWICLAGCAACPTLVDGQARWVTGGAARRAACVVTWRPSWRPSPYPHAGVADRKTCCCLAKQKPNPMINGHQDRLDGLHDIAFKHKNKS